MSEAFDPETCEVMSRALSHALKQLETSGLLNGKGREQAEAALTKGVLEAVTRGERDEFKLAAHAIANLQAAAG